MKTSTFACYPNPFYSSTIIEINLVDEVSDAKLIILNILGTNLLEHSLQKGFNRFEIEGNSLPSGIYFARIASTSGLLGAIRLIKSE